MSKVGLTEEQIKSFIKTRRVSYGDIQVDEEQVDIDGLLDAQLADLAQCAPKEALLTDEEMAQAQGDKDVCLAIIRGFGSCEGCSGNCPSIAKAQLTAVWPFAEAKIEQARVEERKKIGRWLQSHYAVTLHGGMATYQLMVEDVGSLQQGK